jgi:hypothetical protein
MAITKFNGFEQFAAGTITKAELETQWEAYKSSFVSTEVSPILDRMQQAKDQYFNAFMDLSETKDQFVKDNNTADSKAYGLKVFDGHVNIEPVHNPESFITRNELTDLARVRNWGDRPFKGVTR